MATRFQGHSRRPDQSTSTRESGLGEWWAAIAIVGIAILSILSLSGSRGVETDALLVDPTEEILGAIDPAQRAIEGIEAAFETLCQEPVLLALELEPDCETGVLTIADELFDGFGSAQLSPDAQEGVRAAVRSYLGRLRRLPALWDSLEAIEIRGHSDPRAVREPYTTNLVGSQQRPLGLLLFLVGPDGLSDVDRNDLERLAIVSGVSFSRPPSNCPEATRECYPDWRRVEIRPVLSERLRRGDWSRTLEDIRASARRATRASDSRVQ